MAVCASLRVSAAKKNERSGFNRGVGPCGACRVDLSRHSLDEGGLVSAKFLNEDGSLVRSLVCG